MSDTELLAKARAKVDGREDDDWTSRGELIDLISALADIAEQRGAMLVEERAKARRMLTADKLEMMEVCWDNYTSDLDKGLYRLDAMRDLQIGASFSWVHIGPEDAEVLKGIMVYLEAPKVIQYTEKPPEYHNTLEMIDVLRRLIGEDKNE